MDETQVQQELARDSHGVPWDDEGTERDNMRAWSDAVLNGDLPENATVTRTAVDYAGLLDWGDALKAQNAQLLEALELVCNVGGVRWAYLPMPLYRAIERARAALAAARGEN